MKRECNPFEGINFIRTPERYDRNISCPASAFRRIFSLEHIPQKAIINVCGLGYGYYYINGRSITDDMFTAPVSNYDKTLWYNSYDVTSFLKEGENVIAVICGNGWYNEFLRTSWDYDNAPWRDKPKFILSLVADGKTVLSSDTSWICTENTPVLYNELRSGEIFDARLYNPKWKEIDYSAEGWQNAISDTTPPQGIFRLCPCDGITENEVLPYIDVRKTGENKYIFDFGKNISGYARLNVAGEAGDEIELHFAEKLTPDGEMEYHNMQNHYRNAPFALDKFICSGEKMVWSPKFTYHGFRYAEVTGLREVLPDTVSAVFVHQNVKRTTGFGCSDAFLNRLFEAGQRATLSNLFYMPTDCPTREKLGWCNDAQSSCDQMLTDFTTAPLFEKWLRDIYDAMLYDGSLPGIIPSSGWGYGWGNGPVSEGILFEIPYRLYLHTGNARPLIQSREYFDRSLKHFEDMRVDGEIRYGLDDWTSPDWSTMVKAPFVNEILVYKFLGIARLAAELDGDKESEKELVSKLEAEKNYCLGKYIDENGECIINQQTSVSMLIYYGIYNDLAPLAAQLKRIVEERNFHFDVGMVGMRYLFPALNRCGLEEYAFRILTAHGFPSFRDWDEDGMTTLYETWHMKDSLNHHMFSCFMTWMTKTIVGIVPLSPACRKVEIKPYFFGELDCAEGWRDTPQGRVCVGWKRDGDNVTVKVEVPVDGMVMYKGKLLPKGENIITEKIG